MCVWVYVCIIAAAATGFLTRRACLPGPRCAACSGSWSRCEQTKAFTHVPNFAQTRHERQRMLNTTNALDGQGRPETEGHYLPSERSAHAEEQRASAVMNETV
jgi:hypothetical protein